MEKRRVFKPTRNLRKGAQMYRKWTDWEVSDYVIGTLTAINIDNYGKNNYVVKVEEAHFMDKSGKNFVGKTLGINECASLKMQLEGVELGAIIQVTYTGIVKIEKGNFAGKDAHTVDVNIGEMDEQFVEEEEL